MQKAPHNTHAGIAEETADTQKDSTHTEEAKQVNQFEAVQLAWGQLPAPNLFWLVKEGDGYVQTPPLRIHYHDKDPDDPTSRVITSVETLGARDPDCLPAGFKTAGHMIGYVDWLKIETFRDFEKREPNGWPPYGARIAPHPARWRLDRITPHNENDLPVQRARVPAFIVPHDDTGIRLEAAEALLPSLTFNLPMDWDGHMFQHDEGYLHKISTPIPPADLNAEDVEARKVTVEFEFRITRWKYGWPKTD